MVVEIKDDKLVVDATDRSMGYTIVFEHVCGQTKFIAHAYDYYDGEDRPLKAEFVIEDDQASRVGLKLDEDYEDYIWFERV